MSATQYSVVLWFGTLNKEAREDTKKARAEVRSNYPQAPHLDQRGRELQNGEMDFTPEEIVWLSSRYDVMISTMSSGMRLLALSARGDRFGQR